MEVHADHFSESRGLDGMADEEWLPLVGEKGWILLTHDKAMRHRSRERDAIMRHGVRAFMLMGRHLVEDHAANLLRCLHLVDRSVKRQPAAFIAKLYHPTPRDLQKKVDPKGRVEIWLTREQWLEGG